MRPEEVLEKALLMVQNSQKNYLYKCDQLKSIRQDLTVQHIRNELTVKVCFVLNPDIGIWRCFTIDQAGRTSELVTGSLAG